MRWLKQLSNKNKRILGFRLDGNQLHYCSIYFRKQQALIETIGCHTVEAVDALENDLKMIASKLKAKGASVNWSLPSDQYRLIVTTRPTVPRDELIDALRWQIKDQTDFDVEEAVIDAFDYPEALPGDRRVYVVVIHKSSIQYLVDATMNAGLQLNAIDINELSVGNLLIPQLIDDQSIAFISQQEKGVVLSCFLGKEFAFSRLLSGTYFSQASDDDDFKLDDDDEQVNEHLLLEIQRTIDYYESQVARQAITRILLPDYGGVSQRLMDLLKESVDAKVEFLKLENSCQWTPSLSTKAIYQQLALCGSLFRQELNHAAN